MTRFTTLIALMLAAMTATAQVGNLYVGETVLAEGERVSDQALLRALDEVLIRLTGQVDRSPVRTLGLGRAELNSLLTTQHMVHRERPDETGESVTELRLRAEFYEPAVNRLLRDRSMARWGRERPAILLWIAIEDEDGVRLADDPYLDYLIGEHARRLGLDIVRPLGDALDMSEVTLADIRGGFLNSAEAAAQRYGAGASAMLDLRRESGTEDPTHWRARWFWRVQRVDSGFNHSGDEMAAVVRSGMERMAASMAERFTVRDFRGEAGLRRLTVDGIVDVFQYSEVQRYLENLSIVEELRVIGARERSLEFELLVTGDGLEEFLELSGLLTPGQRTADGHLHYRLRR